MRVSLITEHRFHRTPDGVVWAATAGAYSFWARYLSVFDEVNIAARLQEVPRAGDQWVRADGPHVDFSAVPYYVGPYQFAICWLRIRHALRNAIRVSDAVLMRVPSFLAGCIEPTLRKRHHPYGLEVVGDPYDGLAPGGVRHLLRPLLRIGLPRQLRRQCNGAAGVAYVTQRALQQRYPAKGLMTGVSDVVIPAATIGSGHRTVALNGCLNLICVGSLEQFYKGHDVLVCAVAACVARGVDLRLTLVGDGRIRSQIEALAGQLGIRSRCEFLGHLSPGAAVIDELDKADLFVLPSRTEGLPRALIEAMARGLPCISTSIGGIPELLAAEDLVAPDDVTVLAGKICEIADSAARREQMSQRNLTVARRYSEDVLQPRRVEFYRHIRTVTGEHHESSR